MAHEHVITDDQIGFEIDPISREIICLYAEPLVLALGDHNSERHTFRLPRFVEGQDMTKCEVINIHFTNISANGKQTSSDKYEVKDVTTYMDGEEEYAVFTWLINRNATQYVGTLEFSISFECLPDEDYGWSTGIFSKIGIIKTLNNTKAVAKYYSDELNAYKTQLDSSISEAREVLDRIDDIAAESVEAVDEQITQRVGELGVVQESGDSPTAVMSQKATTEYVKEYLPKAATKNLLNVTWQNGQIDDVTGEIAKVYNNNFACAPEFISVIGGETYTFSWIENDKSVAIYVNEYDAEHTLLKETNIGGTNYLSSKQMTMRDDCAFVRVEMWHSEAAPSSFEYIIPENFQMELGAEATPYVKPLLIDNDEINVDDLSKKMGVNELAKKSEVLPLIDTLPSTETIPASEWEDGAIKDADGTNMDSILRLRTKGYIQLRAGDTITSRYYTFCVYEYDIETLELITGMFDFVYSYTVQNDCYVRIMAYYNNANQTVEDIASHTIITHNSTTMVSLAALPIDNLREISKGVAEEVVGRNVEENSLPAYYLKDNYLKNKVNMIRDYISASNGNYDVFFFVSDIHWHDNAKKSPYLIDYLASKVHINRLFTGGDLGDGINIDAMYALKDCFKGFLYNVSGNHDYFDYFIEDGKTSSKTLTGGDVWQYLYGHMTDAVVGDASRNYYYVDNITQKMRYIILSAFTKELTNTLGAEQETWLRDIALDMPDGYTAVIFTHSMGEQTTDNSDFILYGAGVSIESICDASEANIACIVAGHTHVDFLRETSTRKIPIFITTCDKYKPWISNGVDMETFLANRVEGTITEQAFDVFIIDKTNRQINAVRIGCPAIDGVTPEMEEFEVRTKAY